MATITDFETWLDCTDLDDYNDVYSLYKAVEEIDSWSSFEVTKLNNPPRYILKCCYVDDALLLGSENARETFLKMIEERYCEDMPIEVWYAYKHSMAKDD